MDMEERVILASASPRRRELLAKTGLQFEVVPSKGEETFTSTEPPDIVMELAEKKANELAERYGDGTLVIGADTIVVKDGQILGKPADTADAERMVTLLAGSVHQVYTGVCLIRSRAGRRTVRAFYEMTDVEFYPMNAEEIRTYVSTGESMDKAGAYGIQGGCAVYIRGIRGDYNNVVGLPVARLYHEIRAFQDTVEAGEGSGTES